MGFGELAERNCIGVKRAIASLVLLWTLGGFLQAGTAAAARGAPARTSVLLLISHRSAALDRFVAGVSDPASPLYRHFLTIEQLEQRFGPSGSAERTVARWLRVHHLNDRLGPTRTYVDVSLTAAQKRVLFPGGTVAQAGSRSNGLAVPPPLAGAVSAVINGRARIPGAPSTAQTDSGALAASEGFNPQGSSVRPRTGTPLGCHAGVHAGTPRLAELDLQGFTPNQYLTAYGFPRLIRQDLRGDGERIAVVEFGGFRSSDVATFARCFSLPMPHLKVIPVLTPRPLPPLDETTLDLEVLAAAAPRATSIDVYEGAPSTAEGFAAAIAQPLLARSRRPNVESISYGICEPNFAGQVPVLRVVNTVLEFEAAAGISVFASSGDTGSTDCSLKQNSEALPVRAVGFPASSPYVAAVGGLNFTLTHRNRLASELVWNNSPLGFGAGGGGTSLLFDRPSWQAVPGAASVMREVPDVAMLADNAPGYAIYCTPPACPDAGETTRGWLPVGGTSAAAPLLAGGVADADQEAARHHQPPLGLIDPLLYDVSRAPRLGVTREVVRGNDDLGTLINGSPIGCCSAHRGYDDASGLGSVNVDAFSRAGLRAYRHAVTLPAEK